MAKTKGNLAAADIGNNTYQQLHDGLSDMIENERLTCADIPDDYEWLVQTLENLACTP